MLIQEGHERLEPEAMEKGQVVFAPAPAEMEGYNLAPEPDEEYLDDIEESPEDRMLEAIAGDRRRLKKHESAIKDFLGRGKRVEAAVIFPRYYGDLLTWALHRHLAGVGWKTIRVLSFNGREPRYINVDTGSGLCENLLSMGTMFLKKGRESLVVTIDLDFHSGHSLVVKGPASKGAMVKEFAGAIETIAKEQNFYRNRKLALRGRLHFLKVEEKSWEEIALDAAIKEDIRANTVGFLARSEVLASYGVPARRGVILAGVPGTGKTLICKALMAECRDLTCIMADTYGMVSPGYITELYELAKDLAPSLVFIEDLDQIGESRRAAGSNPHLLSLLSVLDGVEAQKEIVTVATTNFLDTLDKALSRRPSRFDRIIELSLPELAEREKLVAMLCRKAPMDEDSRRYVAEKTDGFTPAQMQEVIYSLVIEHVRKNGNGEVKPLTLTREEIDRVISRVGKGNEHPLGFRAAAKEAGANGN